MKAVLIILFICVSHLTYANDFDRNKMVLLGDSQMGFGTGNVEETVTHEVDYSSEIIGCALVEMDFKGFLNGLSGYDYPIQMSLAQTNLAIEENPGSCLNLLTNDYFKVNECEINGASITYTYNKKVSGPYNFKYLAYCLLK